MTPRSKVWQDIKENFFRGLFLFCGVANILILAGIFWLLFSESWPALKSLGLGSFFGKSVWRPDGFGAPSFGLWPAIYSTFLTTAVAMAISVPLGVGTAVYLNFVADSKVREILKPVFELLASIPSVVVGFIGIVITGPWIAKMFSLNHGLTALNGGLLLALMSLPTIISVSEDALYSVPKDLWKASLALGATRTRTIWRVMIPAGRGGLLAAIMLGMGRAIGETMTVLMAAGNTVKFPDGLLSPVKTLTATIAMELGEVPFGSIHYHSLFVIGMVLFLITFAVNILGEWVIRRQRSIS